MYNEALRSRLEDTLANCYDLRLSDAKRVVEMLEAIDEYDLWDKELPSSSNVSPKPVNKENSHVQDQNDQG